MELDSYDSLFYDINMGYIIPPHSKPGDSVAYWEKENTFQHAWSLEHRFYQYGYYRQNELFGNPGDFLKMPADLVDMIVTKIGEGSAKRMADEKAIADSQKGRKDKSLNVGIPKELLDKL